jgi:diguanylate cyclase (GGDEF)-like protein
MPDGSEILETFMGEWPDRQLSSGSDRRYPGDDVRVLRGMDAPVAPKAEEPAESPRFMWLMAAVLFFTGASIGALSLIVPHPESFDDAALWSNVGLAYGGSLLCVVAAARAPVWLLHVVLVTGIVLIARAAHYSGEPNGFYSLFFVWIGLYTVFFFSRAAALAYLAAIGVAFAWLLADLDASASAASWITTIGTVALGAFLIDYLVRRLRGMARASAQLAQERADLMATLAEVARTDDLTGLPNRRAWDEALERELARARREHTPLCIGLADLDRFKVFNDEHGHQAGDRLLKQIASAWAQELRTTDVLARYGGEEFALALSGCDLEDGEALAERLRAAMPEEQTCSVGLVCWDTSEDAEELFGRADRALYAAKEAGRDRVIVG